MDDPKTTFEHRDMGPGFTHFDGPDCGCMRDQPPLHNGTDGGQGYQTDE